jgi:hypothetical protein
VTARTWFAITAIAASFALAGGWNWWTYQQKLQAAAKAYRFKHVEISLTQPPFRGLSTQIGGQKWLTDGPQDIVSDPQPIALNETISLELTPLTTGTSCSPSDITAYEVDVNAPGFTVDGIGDALKSRPALIAPACSLSQTPPPPVPPWRWNLLADQPGDQVITLVLQALDKNGQVVELREVDIPVFVPTPPEPASGYIGAAGVVISILATCIGLWEKFRRKPYDKVSNS